VSCGGREGHILRPQRPDPAWPYLPGTFIERTNSRNRESSGRGSKRVPKLTVHPEPVWPRPRFSSGDGDEPSRSTAICSDAGIPPEGGYPIKMSGYVASPTAKCSEPRVRQHQYEVLRYNGILRPTILRGALRGRDAMQSERPRRGV
jgi:hypothetical protein